MLFFYDIHILHLEVKNPNFFKLHNLYHYNLVISWQWHLLRHCSSEYNKIILMLKKIFKISRILSRYEIFVMKSLKIQMTLKQII